MLIRYKEAIDIAKKLGFDGFSKLQEKAFKSAITYHTDKWLFIIGSTSSGKTLIPLILFFMKRLDKEYKNSKMLFAVPYRALAYQKSAEFVELSRTLGIDLSIAQSTGEYRRNDSDILNGNVDIAIIIYEKLFLFLGTRDDFLSNYDFIVMDEIGITQDMDRGIKIDLLLHELRKKSLNKRVIALGTPFYDWNNYISSFNFNSIQEDSRPIELKTFPIFYTQSSVNYIPAECNYISHHKFTTLNNSPNNTNPIQRTDKIIEDICKYHLPNGQSIFVFINNRNEVKRLSRRLFKSLSESGYISPFCSLEESKQYIRKETGLTDDFLYGILDDEDYLSFSYGISFHNSVLPAQLRALIEKEILTKAGHLRVVCCTETLAFGINSNVDVIIIPSLFKQNKNRKNGCLTSNEFMNYSGRAGRLQPELPIKAQKAVGYSYVFIKSNYYLPDSKRNSKDHKYIWNQLQDEISTPQKTNSMYFEIKPSERPFYLLSLIKLNSTKEGIRRSEIENIIRLLPNNQNIPLEFSELVDIPLNTLIYRDLVYISNDEEDILEIDQELFKVTTVGNDLSGYIINIDDYDNIISAAGTSIEDIGTKTADLLFAIMRSKEIQRDVGDSIGGVYSHSTFTYWKMADSIIEIRDAFSDEYSKKLYSKIESTLYYIKKRLGEIDQYIEDNSYKAESPIPVIRDNYYYELNKKFSEVSHNKSFQSFRLLSAIMMWKSETHTIKNIYQDYYISYEQIKGLAQSVCYRLDIINRALPLVRNSSGELLYGILGREFLSQKQQELKDLSETIYFRIPIRICKFLNVQCEDNEMAQKLIRFARTYDFLSFLEAKKKSTLNKKQKQRLSKIKSELDIWPLTWRSKIEEKFGGILNNESLL